MSSRLRFFAVALCFCAIINQTQAQFGGGNGSSTNPYQIASPEHLAQLAGYVNAGTHPFDSAYYILTADIDLSQYDSNNTVFNNGKGWVPIGYWLSSSNYQSFSGNFNGNGKKITNLYINDATHNYCGVFGRVAGGRIENLGVENVSIAGGAQYVSSVAGRISENSSISNCYAAGKVNNGYNYVGGVVGYVVTNSSISNCYFTGEVSGKNNYVGGVAGGLDGNSSLSNCYFTGNVSGDNYYLGGVAGYVYNNSSLSNCYAIGTVIGNNEVGGVAGGVYSNCTVTNCAALNPGVKATNTSGTTYVGRVAGRKVDATSVLSGNIAFEDMLNNANDAIWSNKGLTNIDGEDISAADIWADGTLGGRFTTDNGWTVENGKLPGLFGNTVEMPEHLYGNGTSENPYLIIAVAQLANYAALINAGDANYIAAHYKLMNDLNLNVAPYNSGTGWEPIGKNSPSYRFKGHFDGNNHKIKGLTINRPTEDHIGLFGDMDKGSIRNLGIEECNITGKDVVGGLAAYIFIPSAIDHVYIENCYVTGNINANNMVGGLVGLTDRTDIINCYTDVNVTATGQTAGGFVGYMSANCLFAYCYATGTVSAGTDYVGGLVAGSTGGASNTLRNCVAANTAVTVANSAATHINRVLGNDYDGKIIISNNYALNTMTVTKNGSPAGITPNINGEAGASKTISELQSKNFYATAGNWNGGAWDITTPASVWNICDGDGLPHLRWQGISCGGSGIEQLTMNNKKLIIYPNPVIYELRIKNYEGGEIQIINITGQTLLSLPSFPSQERTIDVSALSRGVYFLKIGNSTAKFVKD